MSVHSRVLPATVEGKRQSSRLQSRLFLLIAPFLYAAYALLTPPLQSPDEHQHLFRAWQLSDGIVIGERRGAMAGGVLPGGLVTATEQEIGTAALHVSNRPVTKRAPGVLRSTQADAAPARFTNFFGSVIYSPLGYIPQVSGVLLGRAAGASVETIILLGRLLNAALAIGLIALALRLTPWGGPVFLWIGLLPMTAAMSASLGQDGLVIGATCLLLARALRTHAPYSAATIAISAVVGLAKIVYLPFALIGLASMSRKRGRSRFDASSLLPFMIALLLIVTWHWLVSPLQIPPKAGLPSPAERLAMVAAAPSTFFTPLWTTLKLQAAFYVFSNFTFGWLSVGPDFRSLLFAAIALLAVFLAGDPSGKSPGPGRRTWLMLISGGTCGLVFAAMFLLYTFPGDRFIDGIQGRYFLPVAAVLGVAILPRRALAPQAGRLVPWLMVAANVSALSTIAGAFYRF